MSTICPKIEVGWAADSTLGNVCIRPLKCFLFSLSKILTSYALQIHYFN